ncbi:5-demethoxyubiquinol-8 5-hydroxylase UbiM, partial [Neisseria sp. P0016.S009]
TNVKEVKTSYEEAQVILESGEVMTGRLLLAADSRFSQKRRQLGISSDMHDYSRTMFVCRMKHTLSNLHTAYECFHDGRTIALLPLEEHFTKTVITV